MKKLASAVALAVAAAFSLNAAAQTKPVKVQSSWPASLTIQDHLRILSERVDKLTAGAGEDRGRSPPGRSCRRSRCSTPPARR